MQTTSIFSAFTSGTAGRVIRAAAAVKGRAMSRDRARGVAKKGVALAVLATTSIAASLTATADAASAATTQSTSSSSGPSTGAPAYNVPAYNVPAGCSQPDTSMVVTCT
jgi:hypothetical protein